MTVKKEKWYRNNWVITIVGCSLATIFGSLGYDKIKDKPILSTLWLIIKTIWSWVLNVMTFKIAVWIIIVGVAVLWVIRKLAVEPVKPELPAFLNYKQDRFKSWIWRWDWRFNQKTQQWNIMDLIPYCPNDDTQLVNNSSFVGAAYSCPRCNANFSDRTIYGTPPVEDPTAIQTLIIDNIRKGNFRS